MWVKIVIPCLKKHVNVILAVTPGLYWPSSHMFEIFGVRKDGRHIGLEMVSSFRFVASWDSMVSFPVQKPFAKEHR